MLGFTKNFYRGQRAKAADGHMNEETPAAFAPVPDKIPSVLTELQKAFGSNTDIITKPFNDSRLLLCYIDGMVDRQSLDRDVIRPLMEACGAHGRADVQNTAFLRQNVLPTGQIREIENMNNCIQAVLDGQTMLFAEGSRSALQIGIPKWKGRSVEEPKAENVIRGPREGFTENIRDNIVLIRRKIRDCNLIFETTRVGRTTKTIVSICYLRGIADDKILTEVRKRIRNIRTNSIMASGQLEEFIEDSPFSILPTVGHTERPDNVAGKLLDGRIAILCDGTPFVLTVPNLFVEYLESSEDSYNRWIYSPLLKALRLLALFTSVTVPGFYVTLICFHQDVVPFRLLMTIAAACENVPFPPVLECLFLIITFELIREGGIRMPRTLGQAISIVGALIIGQAAVQAGVVSAPSLIVISATAICTFIVPQLDYPMLIIRLVLLFAANVLGFLGLVLSSMVIFIYMCKLKSFGVPYLAPAAPRNGQDFANVLLRVPVWSLLGKSQTVSQRYDGQASK